MTKELVLWLVRMDHEGGCVEVGAMGDDVFMEAKARGLVECACGFVCLTGLGWRMLEVG